MMQSIKAEDVEGESGEGDWWTLTSGKGVMNVDDSLQNLLELVLVRELCIIRALEGEPCTQHDVQDHAATPQIGCLAIVRLSLSRSVGHNFWRHVAWCANPTLGSALQVHKHV